MAMTPGRANIAEPQQYIPLRQPKSFVPKSQQQQQQQQQQPQSHLNGDAEVFESHSSGSSNASCGSAKKELSVNAKEFVPGMSCVTNCESSAVAIEAQSAQEYFADNRNYNAAAYTRSNANFAQQQRFGGVQQRLNLNHQQQMQKDFQEQLQQQQQTNYYAGAYQQQQQQQPQQQHFNNRHSKHNVQQRLTQNQNVAQQQQQQQQQQHTTYFANNAAYATQLNNVTHAFSDHLHINNGAANSATSSRQNYAQAQPQRYAYNNKQHAAVGAGVGGYKTQQQHSNGGTNDLQHNRNSSASGGSGDGRFTKTEQPPSDSEMEDVALTFLKTAINRLSDNPGCFDTVATQFLTLFEDFDNNSYVMGNAMDDVFRESVINSNFRYMGAKLFNLFHMLNLQKDSLFLQLLEAQLAHNSQEMEACMQSNEERKVRETALFLAELYMQLRDDDARLQLLANRLVEIMHMLMCNLSDENVRCICLTLKLAGYDLSVDCAEAVQQIMLCLQKLVQKNPGSKQYALAERVIQLRNENWGRKLSSSTDTASQKSDELRESDEPVFYGPDGSVLTAEENDFLSNDAINVGGGDEEHDTDDIDLDVDFDPEMDEETEQAYLEFCKQQAAAAALK